MICFKFCFRVLIKVEFVFGSAVVKWSSKFIFLVIKSWFWVRSFFCSEALKKKKEKQEKYLNYNTNKYI